MIAPTRSESRAADGSHLRGDDSVLCAAATLFAAAVIFHNSDHLRRGRRIAEMTNARDAINGTIGARYAAMRHPDTPLFRKGGLAWPPDSDTSMRPVSLA